MSDRVLALIPEFYDGGDARWELRMGVVEEWVTDQPLSKGVYQARRCCPRSRVVSRHTHWCKVPPCGHYHQDLEM